MLHSVDLFDGGGPDPSQIHPYLSIVAKYRLGRSRIFDDTNILKEPFDITRSPRGSKVPNLDLLMLADRMLASEVDDGVPPSAFLSSMTGPFLYKAESLPSSMAYFASCPVDHSLD